MLLGVFGVARTHQHNFSVFVGVVVGLAVLNVVVFVATRPREADDPERARSAASGTDLR